MNRFNFLGLILVAATLASALDRTDARAADAFDLSSIGLHPSYLSASAIRENATLHAVAMAPSTQGEQPNQRAVGIAVGDGGTILRTEDAGANWRLIDRITPLAESEEPVNARSRFGSRRLKRRVIAMPAWHFYDVTWLSPSDAVVIGGGFEPVTGISRGVCLFSDDAGATWSMGNAHELPRLKHFVDADSRRSGMIEAWGDRAEASGVDRFFSQDGGRTWIEATVANDASANNATARNPHSSTSSVQVSDYGRIQLNENGTWQTVRGHGRHAAVAFICGSAATTPWSLIGRESLHEHNRVVVGLADPDADMMKHQRWADGAKLFGATVGKLESGPSLSGLTAWLRYHGPTVLALDASLPESVGHAWMDAVASVRKQRHDSQSTLQRVVIVCARVESQPVRDASTFRRSSILRSDALLTGPAVLAGDFASDALMIAAPGTPTPLAVEVSTLDDLSGAIRRDISMTSGITLRDGQILGENERHVASNRRLQIATARVAHTTNLRNQLASVTSKKPDASLRASVEQTLRSAIAMTAPADQTRLLWDRLVELMNHREFSNHPSVRAGDGHPSLWMVRSVIRQQLAEMATPASIRRWAEFAEQATHLSVERERLAELQTDAPKQWDSHGATNAIHQASHEEAIHQTPNSRNDSAAPDHSPRGQRVGVSPFQVAPASYTTPANGMHSPTAILIPESKPTVWQTPRGMAVNGVSKPSESTAIEPNTPDDTLQRTNWDYHPVVMAGRRIGQTDSLPVATNFNPPIVASRPYLDGTIDDACWTEAVSFGRVRVAQDQDFYFIAIVLDERPNDERPNDERANNERANNAACRVRLDCDGDYLTSIEHDWDGDAMTRITVDGLGDAATSCYASGASASERPTSNLPHRTIELAIAKRDLPGPLHRIRVDHVGTSASPWEAMPDATRWFPRQFPHQFLRQ